MNVTVKLLGLVGLLMVKQATAAQLLDLRTGETGNKSRMVLESDEPLNWVASVQDNELVMQVKNAHTRLPLNLMARRASTLGTIKIINVADRLMICAQLKQKMRIVYTKKIPAKNGQLARWLVDLEPSNLPLQVVIQAPEEPIEKVLPIETTVEKQQEKQVQAEISTNHDHFSKQDSDKQLHAPIPPIVSLARSITHKEFDKTKLSEAEKEAFSVQPFQGTRPLVVAIDAGHGGKDIGATSASGVLEKDLTLTMAKALKKHIDSQPGMKAVLTRDDDFFISLGRRPRIAREMGADVFISLHADSYKDSKVKGASFYVMGWDGATSELAKFVAAHSNSADNPLLALNPWSEKLANDLGKMSMSSSIEDSQKLASFMQKGMRKSGIKLQHATVQAANFVVLKNIDMPSVLVEMGFISNPQQDFLLQDSQYQNKIAASIVKGLVNFVQVQPEPGVVYAKFKVNKGDSLARLAERHGTSSAYLARANGLSETAGLREGQFLRIPLSMSHRMAMITDDKG